MDDDIISQGGDRDPGPWPRRLGVIAAVIAVVVGGVVYLTRPGSGRPAASARPTASLPPAQVTPGPVPVQSPQFIPIPAPTGPSGIIGHTTTWEDGSRLPVSGAQPAWFWPGTGRSETIGGLTADDSGYEFTRVGGGWAVQADGNSCGGGACDVAPSPVWFLRDGAQSAVPVGTADLVAPAAGADALWLTSYFPSANRADTGQAREVGPSGAQLSPPVTLPPGSYIDQATDQGLLLTSPGSRSGTSVYTLWNPATRKASRTFDGVIAASATEIAWTAGCTPTACRVDVLDLATGRQTTVALPSGSSASGASFSPDGRLLALQLSYGLDGALAMRLDVASVATGELTEVPRTSVSSDALFAFGWPTEGDTLVAEFTFMPTMQLVSWHPGASKLAVSVLRPGRTQASLIVG